MQPLTRWSQRFETNPSLAWRGWLAVLQILVFVSVAALHVNQEASPSVAAAHPPGIRAFCSQVESPGVAQMRHKQTDRAEVRTHVSASRSSEFTADVSGKPCISDGIGHPHGGACVSGGNCPLCVPIAVADFSLPPAKAPGAIAAKSLKFGGFLSPHERPPKLAQSA